MPTIQPRKTHLLARLEIGLRTDAVRLVELEEELIVVLQKGRGLSREYGPPGDWDTAWVHHWDLVESILRRIHELVGEIQDDIQSRETGRHSKALQTWKELQLEDKRLMQALKSLHGQSVGLNPTAQTEWDAIAKTMEAHMDVVHACAEALHIKLELLKSQTSEEVDEQVQKLLARLDRAPQPRSGNPIDYEQEYQRAEEELQQEKNQFMGFMDVVKCMFTWTESIQERIDKNNRHNTF